MFPRNMIFVLVVFSLFTVTVTAHASDQVREPRERTERYFAESNSDAAKAPEVLLFEGNLHCKDHKNDSKGDHASCELQLTTKNEETYDLLPDEALNSLVCAKHDRHLKVELRAERKASFLFWGGDLKVVDYKVLGELPEDYCVGFEKGETLQDYPVHSAPKRKSI